MEAEPHIPQGQFARRERLRPSDATFLHASRAASCAPKAQLSGSSTALCVSTHTPQIPPPPVPPACWRAATRSVDSVVCCHQGGCGDLSAVSPAHAHGPGPGLKINFALVDLLVSMAANPPDPKEICKECEEKGCVELEV
jgi:hypothetical protein